jgi:uncharacterized BrkB/YihY/UPF0761 family membrane protein
LPQHSPRWLPGENERRHRIDGQFYFSDTILSDSKTYGTIGAIFGIIMTWFIAIGAVIILGAVAGALWADRRNRQVPATKTRP